MVRPSPRRSVLLLLALALAAAALLGASILYRQQLHGRDEAPQQAAEQLIGQARPGFSFPDRLGLMHSVSEWDGQVLVINFWATWCEPCVREIPAFVDLQRDYGARGLRFLGVSLDKPPEVKAFIAKLGVEINYPILIGGEAAIEVASRYGDDIGILPYTVIVNRDGEIAFAQFGELTRDQAEQVLLKLL